MVKINDEWYFTDDGVQFTLIRKYKKKKGIFGKFGTQSDEEVDVTEVYGYFTTLKKMCRRLARVICKEQVDQGLIKTIGEYIDALDRLEEKLIIICKNL